MVRPLPGVYDIYSSAFDYTYIIVTVWMITGSEGIMGMPWRAECLVGQEQGKQGMGSDWECRTKEGKHWGQLHKKGMHGTNTYLTLPYTYAPHVKWDGKDVNIVCLKRSRVLHERITGHPLNTFSAIPLHHAKSMNKSKCWVCSQLPHSFKHGLPLSAVPFSREYIYVGTWFVDKLTQS